MEEFICRSREKIPHSKASRNRRHIPNGMRQRVYQSAVGKRHRRLIASEFQTIYDVSFALNKFKPFLNIVLIDKARGFRLAFFGRLRFEEFIQIEFVKLAAHCNLGNAVRHFISEHDHTRQSRIGVFFFTMPGCLCALFIRICPVENLIFQKFACEQRTERGAGKIQITLCRNVDPCFVDGISGFCRSILLRVEFRF